MSLDDPSRPVPPLSPGGQSAVSPEDCAPILQAALEGLKATGSAEEFAEMLGSVEQVADRCLELSLLPPCFRKMHGCLHRLSMAIARVAPDSIAG